jgi:hypothetical protein
MWLSRCCNFTFHSDRGFSRHPISILDPQPLPFERAAPQVARMTSHSYEVSLYGKFLKGDLKPVLNRIALHSESAHQMHSREVIFDPPDAAQQREANQEPALLRALKELLEPDAKWYSFNLYGPKPTYRD